MKKLTIRDIAKLAGVGKSTVSRVINNDPNVKPETLAKVNEIINEVGYTPSAVARAMNNQPIKTIGIIITRLQSSAESQALSQLSQFFHSHNYEVMILECQMQQELFDTYVRLMAQKKVEGLIYFGYTGLITPDPELFQGNIVTIASKPDNISSVTTNNTQAVEACFDHLLAQGCKSIGFLGMHEEDLVTGHERVETYRKCCEKSGFRPIYRLSDMKYQQGENGCQQLLEQGIDGLLCGTERLTTGALIHLLRENKTQFPLTAVGINDQIQFIRPDIFAADLQYEQTGLEAAKLLMEKMAGDSKSIQAITVALKLLPAELTR
ncbi:LacI family DNA-binding transcriptional regulator [Vibrio sp. Of7-15]|uniref:LacI family DNA-binding transcriptional regulator n=1 Tax=Vibrio sp. Of7-15 TaxID=2724879 RepID=UPI001EF1BEEA|nr:LacI family DNA-binding transcriptional regulator [Vibrio sp. Of7-15]MCG7495383.1 LacI family DNA-binding transcriptional regulator [Vibrio sp. Of7-15]